MTSIASFPVARGSLTLLVAATLIASGCLQPTRISVSPTPQAFEFGRNVETQLQATGLRAITLRSGAGSLRVIGVEGLEQVQVQGTIHVRAKNRQDAERISRQIGFRIDGRNTTGPAIVVVEPQTMLDQDHRVDVVLKVPTGLRVVIYAGSGSVEISGIRGGLHLENREGEVDIRDASGGITVQNDGRRCVIDNIQGIVRISDGAGELRVTQVTGEVYVYDTTGKLFIGFVTGNVTAENNPMGIEMVSVEGQVMLRGIPAGDSDLKGITEIRFAKAREEDVNPPK